jgi:prohibitin 2
LAQVGEEAFLASLLAMQRSMRRFMKPDFGKLGGAVTSGWGPWLIGGGALLAGSSMFVGNMIYNVEAGHRAIKFNRIWGIGSTIYTEGTYFNVPWMEWPIFMDIRTRPREIRSLTGTRDLQMVNISLRTLSRPDPTRIVEIYRRLGPEFDEVVLLSIGHEVLKAVVARFNAQEMTSQRATVSNLIMRELTERANAFGILIDDVAITHLSFSPAFESAVEQKQVAQQQADRAKYLVQKADEEKKATIIKAQGTTKEAELIGHAMRDNPGFAELRRIEQAQQIAKALANSTNRVVLSADSLLLNLVGNAFDPSKAMEKQKASNSGR